MTVQKFEDLKIWQSSVKITRSIYEVTYQGEWKLDFGLRDQIRRATVSISSNIVEWFERSNNNEFIRFLKIAKGSAGEARSQLYIAESIGYIDID